MRKDKVMNQLQAYKSALEEKGYKVVYIGLYGSQNYNLQDKKSDIDAKAIVIPSLKEIVFKQNISRIETFPEGQVDVKDITTFYSVIKKGNFNYIESIKSDYWLGEQEVKDMFSCFEVNLKSIVGAMYEKKKKYLNDKTVEKGKNYHHLVRLKDLLLENKKRKKDFLPFLKYTSTRLAAREQRQFLIRIKREDHVTMWRQKRVENIVKSAERILEEINQNYSIKNIDEMVLKYLEIKLREELR